MKIIMIVLVCFSIYANEISQDAKKGEELYLEANCQKCHNQGYDYDPKKNKIKTYSQLAGWVTSCANFFDIDWFPEDEEAYVNTYLNEIYYKIKK